MYQKEEKHQEKLYNVMKECWSKEWLSIFKSYFLILTTNWIPFFQSIGPVGMTKAKAQNSSLTIKIIKNKGIKCKWNPLTTHY